MPITDAMVEAAAAVLLGRVNASEQEIYAAARAALTAALSQDEWQPIETAPKSHFILLYCSLDKSTWLGKWQGEDWYGVDDMGLTRLSVGWPVSHWRQLPAPPIPTQEER